MSKALTIDELKVLQVGDWVWVTTADNKYGTYGRVCQKFDDENFRVETIESYIVDLYSDYGTKWLAYKNKEQAEVEEYKIDFDEQGGWEVRKYIPAHYQPWFTADTREQAEARLKELQGE